MSTIETYLPIELIQRIAKDLQSADLSALAMTSKDFYAIVNPILYGRTPRSHPHLGLWATKSNQFRTLKLGLEAGIDPNITWETIYPDADDEDRDIYVARWHNAVAHPINFAWNAVHIAAAEGHAEILELLLEKGAAPDYVCSATFSAASGGTWKTTTGGSPLHLAIFFDYLLCVDVLLRSKASICLEWVGQVAEGCVNGMTALAAACRYGSLPIAQLIIEKRYQDDIDVYDPLGNTPLAYAFSFQNWQCFDWLLFMGADVNTRLNQRDTLLVHACLNQSFQEACRLVEFGADFNVKKECSQFEPLHIICERPWNDSLVYDAPHDGTLLAAGQILISKLLEKGADIEARGTWCYRRNDDMGATPLALAAAANNLVATSYLLSKGADLHGPHERGASVLILVCINRHRLPNANMVQLLIDSGADVSQFTRNYGTALEKACLQEKDEPDKLKVIKILLAHGASPLIRERLASPLTAAFRIGDAGASKLMLSKYSSSLPEVDIRAMFRAFLRMPAVDCLALLLDADQDNWISSDNSSVYRLLRALGNLAKRRVTRYPGKAVPLPEFVSLLLNRGARCNYTDDVGDTALTLALRQKCSPSLLRRLLDHGADPNQGQRRDRTPLSIAVTLTAAGEQYECVKLLLDAGAKGIHKRFPGAGDSAFVLATANIYGSPKTVELLLEREPLKDNPKAPIRNMLETAFRFGRNGVLRAIQSHTNVETWIKSSDQYLHVMLDAFHEKPEDITPTVDRLDEWLSCIEYLLGLDADLGTTGSTSLRGWQVLHWALTRHINTYSDHMANNLPYLAKLGIATCLHQKIEMEPETSFHQFETPRMIFNTEKLSVRYPPSMTMLEIGKRA